MHDYLTTAAGILTRRRDWLGRAALIGAVMLASPATAADWQSVEDIKAAAESWLRESLGGGDERIVPKAGHLDDRLQLPSCDTPLEVSVKNGEKTLGRMVVGVRCPGGRPWNVYLPVHVALMDEVLVAARSLPRNHRLEAGDLEISNRDVSELSGGYLTDPSAILGHELRRPVVGGMVITDGLVAPPVLVERGQIVTLTVDSGSLSIRMTGKALMDGSENQRIRVENVASGRIVEGLVRSAQVVQVIVQ